MAIVEIISRFVTASIFEQAEEDSPRWKKRKSTGGATRRGEICRFASIGKWEKNVKAIRRRVWQSQSQSPFPAIKKAERMRFLCEPGRFPSSARARKRGWTRAPSRSPRYRYDVADLKRVYALTRMKLASVRISTHGQCVISLGEVSDTLGDKLRMRLLRA